MKPMNLALENERLREQNEHLRKHVIALKRRNHSLARQLPEGKRERYMARMRGDPPPR